jgi:hypothetical protein
MSPELRELHASGRSHGELRWIRVEHKRYTVDTLWFIHPPTWWQRLLGIRPRSEKVWSVRTWV